MILLEQAALPDSTALQFQTLILGLSAMQLRLQGNAEARGGDLKAAEQAYSKGLELEVSRGKHLLHANRSGVRLTLGNAQGALEDAQAAIELAPPGFTTAYVRQVCLICHFPCA